MTHKYDPEQGRWVSEAEVQEKLTQQQRQEEFDTYVEATKLLVRAAAVYERTLSESATRGFATPHLHRAIAAVNEASNLALHHFPTWLLPEEGVADPTRA